MSTPPEQPYYPPQNQYPPQPPSPQPWQPGQQQPSYQQGEPSYFPGGAMPSQPPKKSRAGRIVLIVLAVLVVLCGGGIAVAYVTLKDDVQDVVKAAQTRVVAPDTVAGRAKINEPELQRIVTEMVDGMKKDLQGETSTVAAFYGEPAEQDMFMIAAASGLVRDPRKQLDDAFVDINSSGLNVGGLKDVAPGPLGGYARCGDGQTEDIAVAICGWSDSGSIGIVAVYFKTVDEIKDDFLTIRGQVEQRS